MKRFRPAAFAVIALAAAALVETARPVAAESLSSDQRQAIEAVVRDYLVKHPEVIADAIEELQRREHMADAEKQKQALAQNRSKVYDDPAAPVGGNPGGDLTVVEFFDYQCGYCKGVQADVQKLIKDDGRLRFVFKEFPILGPGSVIAAKAALAARGQGKYVELHDALMAHRGQLDEAGVMKLATAAGLDAARLKKDMATPEVEQALAANLALADQLGIHGTPGFVIGDQIVPGAIKLDEMKKLVEQARRG